MNKLHILFCSFLLIAGLTSCEDMMDIHKDLIKKGEITYLAKTDSVEAYAGNSQVLIKCILRNAYNVDNIWVYWNEKSDSMVFDYNMNQNIDSIDLLITGLAEKAYTFDIYTRNSAGNRSVKVSTSASAYGELYRSSLVTRTINTFGFTGTDAGLSWLSSEESEKGTQIRYTTTEGIVNALYLSSDSSKIVMPSFSDLGPIEYRSFFIPEASAIDSFATDWATFEIPPTFYIFNSVVFEPKTGGMNVSWNNPLGVTVSVKVQYLNNKGVLTTKVFKTSPGSITALDTAPRDFKVTVTDASGGVYGPKIFNLAALK